MQLAGPGKKEQANNNFAHVTTLSVIKEYLIVGRKERYLGLATHGEMDYGSFGLPYSPGYEKRHIEIA